MSPSRILGIGLTVAAVLVAVMIFIRRDYLEPQVVFLIDMEQNPGPETQRDYQFSPFNKMAQQAVPEGTLYRGQVRYRLAQEDIEQAKKMENPIMADAAVLLRGERMFRNNCTPCHGYGGTGTAPVADFGMGGPALAGAESNAAKMSDGELYHTIYHGVKRGGAITMPGHADHVRPDDRWKLIHYLRSLQGK